MKKWKKIIITSAAAYFLLVFLLMLSEQSSVGMIHNFGDAIWYSLVTMTTVGYGDIYPVTAVGKLIGSVFLLASLGLLAVIVNAVFSFMTGKWLPGYKLWKMRKRTWYIFSDRNQAADALAENLLKDHPDALVLFCSCPDPCAGQKVTIRESIQELSQKKQFQKGNRNLFLISEDEGKNRLEASELTAVGCPLYCRSVETDSLSDVIFFEPQECCARSFWKEYNLKAKDQKIIVAGDGAYAKALFHQAVLVNSVAPFRTVSYQLIGEWNEYRQMHPGLTNIFQEKAVEEGKDVLVFSETLWDQKSLEMADRIILCSDNFTENAKRALEIQQLFAIQGTVYVLGDDMTVPGICFGKTSELFTEELVMKQEQDQIARNMHESYRTSVGGNAPAWNELNRFLKASNRAVADHLPVKAQLLTEYGMTWQDRDEQLTQMCRRNEHERWSRFHYLHNWSYAPIRDNRSRKHSCLVPYDQLSEKEQAKDDFAWDQLLEDRDN